MSSEPFCNGCKEPLEVGHDGASAFGRRVSRNLCWVCQRLKNSAERELRDELRTGDTTA